MDKIKSLNRVIATLSPDEAALVTELFNSGKKTGYATIDKPWEDFYKGIEKKDTFLKTTPYQGLVMGNKDYPKDKAIQYFGTTVTYGELFSNIDKVAKSLQEYGVKKGDFVTICSTTTPEVVYLFYALSKIGAVANLTSPFFTPEQLMKKIDECESDLVIMVDKFLPKFKESLNSQKDKNIIALPMMNSSVLRFFTKGYKVDGKSNETSWKDFIMDGSKRSDALVDPYEPNKRQAMVYSSGSTGELKGILHSVDVFQVLINAYGNSGFDTSRGQKVFENIPPWHLTGITFVNFPLSYGVCLCTDPRFDHDVFIKNILKYKPEYILTNTSMYQGFTTERNLRRLNGKSLSFLKYPVEGGEPLTETDIRNIEEVFHSHGSNAVLLNGYGECECGGTVSTDITSCKFSKKASGIPLPDITTVGIFDDSFNELKYGVRGNIAVNTKLSMLEYFKNKEATEKFFFTDSSGVRWCQTGDIGYINEDGSLVVLGRASDYSVINGDQIYNFDIESAILTSPLVKLCEVQTHPEDDNKLVAHIVWENEVAAKIKEEPGLEVEYLSEIQNGVFGVLNNTNAVPRLFCVRDGFPSAPSGKRDIKFIKQDVKDIIETTMLYEKKLVR